MKILANKNIVFAIVSLVALSTGAQVSISNGTPTTAPKGLLDMQNSTAGIVYPRFELTDTEIEAPVENPDGSGSLVPGTVVYNTNTTSNGLGTDVYPGLYAWDGMEWTTQYIKEDSEISVQSSLGQRVARGSTAYPNSSWRMD